MKQSDEAKLMSIFAGFPVRLQFKSDLHLARKAWHMIMGLVIVYCYLAGMSRSSAVLVLSCFLGADLLIELSRLRIPSVNEAVLKYWGIFMRTHEVTKMSTIPYYISAAILAIGLFPKPVAILSMLYLACGDPVASFVGILYGHRGPKICEGKTLIGTLAGVFSCFILSFIYLKTVPGLTPEALWIVSLVGGLAGGTVELLPLDIDDNFTIPVISGFVVWAVFLLFGI